MRVFFDSDVIIAGTFSATGASHVLLQLAEVGIIRGYISDQVVDECSRNLQDRLPAALPLFQSILNASFLTLEVPDDKSLSRASDQADRKDIPILAAAMQAGADVLVTFNTKDYFPHGSTLTVLTPRELLKKIGERP